MIKSTSYSLAEISGRKKPQTLFSTISSWQLKPIRYEQSNISLYHIPAQLKNTTITRWDPSPRWITRETILLTLAVEAGVLSKEVQQLVEFFMWVTQTKSPWMRVLVRTSSSGRRSTSAGQWITFLQLWAERDIYKTYKKRINLSWNQILLQTITLLESKELASAISLLFMKEVLLLSFKKVHEHSQLNIDSTLKGILG
jgi:hypothetical protein